MTRRSLLLGAALLAAAAPLAAQGFGVSAGITSGDLLIGALTSRAAGAVLVYRRAPNGTWAQRARLTASDSAMGDRFGATLAVDGEQLLVGGPLRSDTGAVYVFQRERRGTWTEAARLARPAGRRDAFGASLAISGDVAAVGSPGTDSARGRVVVYRRVGGRWQQDAELTAAEPAVNERFGASVSLQGGRLVVGGPGRENGTGAAYVYRDLGAGQWRQESRLVMAGMPANARFGSVVAQRDSQLFISAPQLDQFSGAIYVFGRDTTGDWASQMLLRPFDQSRNQRFGSSFGFDGSAIYVGAPGAAQFSGAVYRARRDSSGRWTDMIAVRPADGERGDRFGGVLAAGAGVAYLGAPGDDGNTGAGLIAEPEARGVALRLGAKFWAEEPGLTAVTGREIRCDGRADRFGCNSVDLVSFLPIPAIGGRRGVNLNDIWGWTDPQSNHEYALVGRTNGTSFVDVTDPANPVYLGDLPMTTGANPGAWRDIKVYRDHAFIVADGSGQHGMQVFDLTQLRSVRPGRPVTFAPVTTYGRVASVHNIVINEESGFAYAVGANSGGETCGGGLHMIDIRQPRTPTFAGCFADTTTGIRRTGYSHDAQCVMYRGPDQRYRGREICIGSNETALSIADVTDKTRPAPVSTISYPNVAYTHQGWFDEQQRYFYVDDEGDELSGTVSGTRTLIFDLQDLREPQLAGQYISQNPATDHNLYVKGDLIFESNYSSGLRVLDISNRTQPREVGFLDTDPFGADAAGFTGTWSNYPYFRSGIVIVSSIGEGLFVVRPRVDRPIP